MGKEARSLTNIEQVSEFMRYTLHLDRVYKGDKFNEAALEITGAEAELNGISGRDTLEGNENRLPGYRSESERTRLRKQIYDELISRKRPKNDDDIALGVGGALPRTKIQRNKKAFFLIGLPASGKSGIASIIADTFGAITVDSDMAKRKMPEFRQGFGASIVHEESSAIVFGGFDEHEDVGCVLSYAASKKMNLVIPKIGDTIDNILSLATELQRKNEATGEEGYENHLILVRLDRKKAAHRAIDRYLETRRYVSIPLIYDIFSNNPTITYFDLMTDYHNIFKSFTSISTDVKKGEPPKILQAPENSPIRQTELWQEESVT